MASPKLLLLQIRDEDDPMRLQEVQAFLESIPCESDQLATHDLLESAPSLARLTQCDVVLVGGSGNYSVTSEADWLYRTLDVFRWLHDNNKPTFASCWGFQAMSRALGGRVVHDESHAELGTIPLFLTEAGSQDPLFSALGETFDAQAGHEDCVIQLPPDAQLLASSASVANQAYCFPGRPIYGTQFHPELSRKRFLERVIAYPQYIERITGLAYEEFLGHCHDTPQCRDLLGRFLELVL